MRALLLAALLCCTGCLTLALNRGQHAGATGSLFATAPPSPAVVARCRSLLAARDRWSVAGIVVGPVGGLVSGTAALAPTGNTALRDSLLAGGLAGTAFAAIAGGVSTLWTGDFNADNCTTVLSGAP